MRISFVAFFFVAACATQPAPDGFAPLDWDGVRRLRDEGYEIGSHSRSHYDCGSSDRAALAVEVEGSKRDLEEHLGATAEFFSFPWGRRENISREAFELATATYAHVLSASGGANWPVPGAERHLRRINHSNGLWELELALQQVLDLRRQGGVADLDAGPG